MILKKPYAFLIKHFRLIHTIITIIMGYLVYKNMAIYKYINSVIKDISLKYNALNYINNNIYIYIAIIIVLFLVVYYLLKYKNKPRFLYLISIITYLIIGIFLFSTHSYLTSIVNNAIDQKTIRLFRDLSIISLFTQYFLIILMGIRALGFDIKKFNFNKDAADLNITNEDNEEIILDINISTRGITRYLHKQKREFSYYFQEYKKYIIIIITAIIIFLGYKYYKFYQENNKIYSENMLLGETTKLAIKESYYDTNKNIVIINFSIYKSGRKEKLNIENMALLIGKNKYYPNKNICNNYNTIGTCYKQQYITNTSKNYIVTYSVDKNINEKYLLYNENENKSYKVKLNTKNYQ